MLFLPLCKFLEQKRLPRVLAILVCLLIIIISISGILVLFYSQVAALGQDMPLFKQKAWEKFRDLEVFVESVTHITADQQTQWIKSNYSQMLSVGSDVVRDILMGLTSGLEVFLIVIVYTFFFLLLRHRLMVFILKLFPLHRHTQVAEVIKKTQNVTRHYMTGQLQVLVIVGLLNWIGFMFLGVKQAFFWGMLRGLLNIIPYVGAVLGGIFPLLSAMTYNDGIIYPIGVVGVVLATQLIQDNYLIPKIIGSHIKINPLATIMAIFSGGMLWGLNGLVLFLPLLGIIKIICDNVDVLKPFGYLLGEGSEDELK
jgi:AI-2 transport protein TqsA